MSRRKHSPALNTLSGHTMLPPSGHVLRNGGSVLELKRMLGHEQLNTVRIYASLAEPDLQEAQRKASPADNWRL